MNILDFFLSRSPSASLLFWWLRYCAERGHRILAEEQLRAGRADHAEEVGGLERGVLAWKREAEKHEKVRRALAAALGQEIRRNGELNARPSPERIRLDAFRECAEEVDRIVALRLADLRDALADTRQRLHRARRTGEAYRRLALALDAVGLDPFHAVGCGCSPCDRLRRAREAVRAIEAGDGRAYCEVATIADAARKAGAA